MHVILILTHSWYSTINMFIHLQLQKTASKNQYGRVSPTNSPMRNTMNSTMGTGAKIQSCPLHDPQQGINEKIMGTKKSYQIILKIGVMILRNEVAKTITIVFVVFEMFLMYVMFNCMNQEDEFILRSLLFKLGGFIAGGGFDLESSVCFRGILTCWMVGLYINFWGIGIPPTPIVVFVVCRLLGSKPGRIALQSGDTHLNWNLMM